MKEIRVLVVDDAAFVRDLVKKGLRDHFPGVQITETSDGHAACVKMQKERYHLVLCDWEMPNMSGDEVLQWMRAREHTREVPFVMITSRGERENVMRAIELKADNYIVKPFTADKLIGVVSRVLSRSMNVSEESLRGLPPSRVPSLSGEVPVAATLSDVPSATGPTGAQEQQPAAVRPREKVLTQLRFGSNSTQVLIKELTLERLHAVMRRNGPLPTILDMAVLDFETADGQVSRINGYMHTLQAREDRRESEFVNVTVTFVDNDPEKMTHLGAYIAELSGK